MGTTAAGCPQARMTLPNLGLSQVNPSDEILGGAQRAHWEQMYDANPGMY